MIESIFLIKLHGYFIRLLGCSMLFSFCKKRSKGIVYIYIIIYIILLMIEFKGIDGAVEQISNVPVNT